MRSSDLLASSSPLLGGSLSRPADHFPTIFVAPFWRENPYFFPCAVAATFALLSFILILLKFEEVGLIYVSTMLRSLIHLVGNRLFRRISFSRPHQI